MLLMTSYHHGNLRAALVEAATELVREKGADGVVLREVARRTGVSHNAAYRHFADREALLGAVAGSAMEQLAAAMEARIAAVTEPDRVEGGWERLAATGRSYVEFALAEPGLFSMAFAGHDMPELPDGPYTVLCRVLDELVAAGAISPERRVGADLVCWAAVHGFAALHVGGPLRVAGSDAPALDIVLEAIRRGLSA
jgi:AcrR family transcriptional regulator